MCSQQLQQYAEFERRLVDKLHAHKDGGGSSSTSTATAAVGREIGSFVSGVVRSVTETERHNLTIAITIGAAALSAVLFGLLRSQRR
jgi:hypothetical protein